MGKSTVDCWQVSEDLLVNPLVGSWEQIATYLEQEEARWQEEAIQATEAPYTAD